MFSNRRLLLVVLLGLAAFTFASCTSERNKAYNRISGMQDSLYVDSTGMVNLEVAGKLLEECTKFAATYPDDTASALMLVKAKDYAIYVNDPIRAVKIMEQFLEKYPTNDYSGDMRFSLAFVYENHLGDLNKAKENYEAYLRDFPDQGKLTQDAQFALDHLGMTADQILDEITLKTDSLSALTP